MTQTFRFVDLPLLRESRMVSIVCPDIVAIDNLEHLFSSLQNLPCRMLHESFKHVLQHCTRSDDLQDQCEEVDSLVSITQDAYADSAAKSFCSSSTLENADARMLVRTGQT